MVKNQTEDDDLDIKYNSFFTKKKKGNIPILQSNNDKWYLTKENNEDSQIEVKDDNLFLIPFKTKDMNTRCFISGPSGSGKSSIANRVLQEIKKIDKKNKEVLYCSTIMNYDKAYNKEEFKKFFLLDLNSKENINVLINIYKNDKKTIDKYVRNSIIIMDDYESSPFFKNIIRPTIEHLLEVGRKMNTHIILINHTLKGGLDTKKIINESNYVITFPGMNKQNVRNFYKDYCSLTLKDERKVFNKTQYDHHDFLIIHKSYPNHIITKNKAFMLE